MPSLSPLFAPARIAVVGASDRIGSIGRKVYTQLTALPQFQSVIPVNPNHKTIGGQKSYANLSEAASEHTIDLAIIVLSADKLASIIREAAKIHLRHLILINELDSAPSAWRNKLNRAAEAARKARINLISLPSNSLAELFKQPENTPKACAYIGQSTSIADCVARYAQERDITFSRLLTLNTQNYPVSTGQIIDHIAAETSSTALLVHISTLNDNLRELISALTAAARRKPVVVLITLHDANPQAEAMLLQALERQHILIAHTLEQFFSAAKLIHTGIISRGKRIAIISNSPQISTLTLKTLRRKTDLQLTEPQAHTIRSITKYLPYKPSHHNPLYLLTDALPATFQAAASQYLQDEHIDAIFIIYTGQNTAESQQVAQMVSTLQKNSRKPLLLVWLGSADTPQVRALFNQRKILHFKQPESAIQALAQLNLYHRHNQQRPPNPTPAQLHPRRPRRRRTAQTHPPPHPRCHPTRHPHGQQRPTRRPQPHSQPRHPRATTHLGAARTHRANPHHHHRPPQHQPTAPHPTHRPPSRPQPTTTPPRAMARLATQHQRNPRPPTRNPRPHPPPRQPQPPPQHQTQPTRPQQLFRQPQHPRPHPPHPTNAHPTQR